MLPNPKDLTNSELWYIILNMFPKHAPTELKEWYAEMEKEFYNRDIKLIPIMNCEVIK